MAYGFEIYNSSGDLTVSNKDYAVMVHDVFQVSALSSGTKEYANLDWVHFARILTSQGSSGGASLTTYESFNSVTTSADFSPNGTLTVGWSPQHQQGTLMPVEIMVLVN